MAADGTWKLTINTPMGPQESTLVLAASGAALTGTQSAGSGEGQAIEEGAVEGDAVRWKASISRPMPLTLEFSGAIAGDTISGSVKLGMFGTSSFSGSRA
jgi:hypothetical protein